MCTETYTDQLFIHHRCQALAHRLEEEMVTLVTLSLYSLTNSKSAMPMTLHAEASYSLDSNDLSLT